MLRIKRKIVSYMLILVTAVTVAFSSYVQSVQAAEVVAIASEVYVAIRFALAAFGITTSDDFMVDLASDKYIVPDNTERNIISPRTVFIICRYRIETIRTYLVRTGYRHPDRCQFYKFLYN